MIDRQNKDSMKKLELIVTHIIYQNKNLKKSNTSTVKIIILNVYYKVSTKDIL